MTIAEQYPSIKPSLSLDFASTKRLDPRITFSRASTATFYDGKTVAKAEENLLLYSQEFDNAAWGKTNSAVTANTAVAPDGTSTADTINEGTAAGQHYVSVATSMPQNGAQHTVSVFAKYIDCQYIRVSLANAGSYFASAAFDIQSGTVASTNVGASLWTIHSTSITDVGNGWYRCVMTASTTYGLAVTLRVATSNSGTVAYPGDIFGLDSYTGTSRTAYLWGAQLEQRSSVTAYTPTTTQPITNYIPVLQTAQANTARFDHNPVTGESLGLRVEEQRTNLVLRSEDLSNAAWLNANTTVTANVVVAPDGTLTGDKSVETTATGVHETYQGITAAAVAHTGTVYLRAAERTKAQVYLASGGTVYSGIFDLVAGTVGSLTAGTTATITAVGNNWYRCSVSATLTATTWYLGCGTVTGTNTTSYTGDGYSGIYIWGAQLEAGSFATSYIKTEASQVTRSADSASMTGTNFSSWYNQSEGTVYFEGNSISTLNSGLYSIESDVNNGNTVLIYPSNYITWQVISSGALQVNTLIGPYTTAGALMKVATAAKTNDFASSVNGGAITSDTVGINPTCTTLRLGNYLGGGASYDYSGYIRKLAYYPKRLTNTQLQALTQG